MGFLDIVKQQYEKGKVNIDGVKLSDDFVTTIINRTTSAISPNAVHNRLDEAKIKFTATKIQTVATSWTEQSPGGVQMKIEFMTDSLNFEMKVRGDNNANYNIFIDGKLTNVGTLNSNAGGSTQSKQTPPVESTASKIISMKANGGVTRKLRHVEIYGINFSFSAIITEPNDTITSLITNSNRPFIYQIGDSYTFGTGAGYKTAEYGSGCAVNDFYAFRSSLGFDGYAEGVGGLALGSSGNDAPYARIANRLTPLAQKRKVDVVSIALGYNDASDILEKPQKEDVIVDAIYKTVGAIKIAAPGASIIAISCASPKGITDKIQKILDITLPVYAKLGIPVINASGYVTAANSVFYTGTDNVHPNPLGHEFRGLAMARESLIAALSGKTLIPDLKQESFKVTFIERNGFAVNVKTETVMALSKEDAVRSIQARAVGKPDLRFEIIRVE